MTASVVLAALAAWLAVDDPRGRVRRLRGGTAGGHPPSRRDAASGPGTAVVSAVLAGCGVAVFVTGPLRLPAGLAAAVALHRWMRQHRPAAEVRDEQRARAALPLALDLLGGCLRAGLPLPDAVDAALEAVDEALTRRLTPVRTAMTLGAGPAEAWQVVADDAVLGPVAVALTRTTASGAPPADVLGALAARVRVAEQARAQQAARAVGVWATLPLVLCFLPAFVLVGVVPVAWGLLRGLL